MIFYICEKIHKKTGKIYICKTQQDPFKYEGSGTEWREHLREHGKSHSTKILFESSDVDEVKKFCQEYADKNPEYWKKSEYANMIMEGGGNDNTGERNPNYKHGRAVGWKSDKKIQKENDKIRNAKYHAENRDKELKRMREYYHRKKAEKLKSSAISLEGLFE